ncbi:MAG: threonine/serine dehydratase [Acidobacteriota bacterium]|nr:threonine/serine dehydratase [Acidobacteriota bacterium]
MTDVTLPDIETARERIASFVSRTPLALNHTLSSRLRTNVYLKYELLQKTGSFKVRGAFNKALSVSPEARGRGFVAVSGGNHAQAVAYVGAKLGVAAIIVMPDGTPRNYVDATRGYGAEVVFAKDAAEAFDRVASYEREGWVAIHPFDDPLVIAGQGTVGLEILEDAHEITDLIISIGGGGFMGGIATAVKATKPAVRIWGVETNGADAMARALAQGQPVQMPAITSIARTLGAPAVSPRTLAMAQRYLESVTVVEDSEAVAACVLLLERAKVLTEPAASCTLAAADRLRERFTPESHVVLVLCGGNVSLEDLCRFRTLL